METKEKVYKLAWELFKDECPLAKKGLFYFTRGYTSNEQLFIILFEILPAGIMIGMGIPYCLRTARIYRYDFALHTEEHIIYYAHLNTGQTIGFPYKGSTNIWQAILSLLEAIKEHPERGRFEYKWRNDG